jgi:anti-sigma factor RsiW
MSHNTEAVTGLLDGELKGTRLRLAKRHINTCPVCALEYRHQVHVRRMLQANPPATVMGDSPEFFWSKVKSEIQRRGKESFEIPLPRLALSDWLRQYQFAMATAVALVIAAGSAVWLMQTVRRAPGVTASATMAAPASVPASFAQIEQLKTPVPHSAATTFDTEDDDATVIWVTGLPWTPDMNEMKTQFANLDT